MDKNTFINLYKFVVKPHQEYANLVWSPYKKVMLKPSRRCKRVNNNHCMCNSMTRKQHALEGVENMPEIC